MGRSGTGTAIDASITRAVSEVAALHYLNSPGQGYHQLKELKAIVSNLLMDANDDPLLFAYQSRDVLPHMAGHLLAAQRWVARVLDADSPDLPSTGVH